LLLRLYCTTHFPQTVSEAGSRSAGQEIISLIRYPGASH